jgi:hypothetical protein
MDVKDRVSRIPEWARKLLQFAAFLIALLLILVSVGAFARAINSTNEYVQRPVIVIVPDDEQRPTFEQDQPNPPSGQCFYGPDINGNIILHCPETR